MGGRARGPETSDSSQRGLDQPAGRGCDNPACSVNSDRRCLNVVDRFRVAQFERSLIGIRTEEGRRTAQARDVPFERPPKLRPDQRILARQLIEQEGQSVSEVA